MPLSAWLLRFAGLRLIAYRTSNVHRRKTREPLHPYRYGFQQAAYPAIRPLRAAIPAFERGAFEGGTPDQVRRNVRGLAQLDQRADQIFGAGLARSDRRRLTRQAGQRAVIVRATLPLAG